MYNFDETFCNVNSIKIPSTDSKKYYPTYDFSTWGAYDQIFSQFLKITFNNVVRKFAKICEKNSQSFLRKYMREKLLL